MTNKNKWFGTIHELFECIYGQARFRFFIIRHVVRAEKTSAAQRRMIDILSVDMLLKQFVFCLPQFEQFIRLNF